MSDETFSRQSFLGDDAHLMFAATCIGMVGASGGGSQVLPQLVLAGFRRFVLYDPKVVEDKHRNRNPMIDFTDVKLGTNKTEAAARRVYAMAPEATVETYPMRWQDHVEPLQRCDLVIGGVDGFEERLQLEAECRRYLIPYVDLGLDVTPADGERPRLAGQVVLSMPGYPCLRCLQIVTDEKLRREAENYGAGVRAQVGWANGVLACMAVNVVVDLLTGWAGGVRGALIRNFDANLGVVTRDQRAEIVEPSCDHFPLDSTGLGSVDLLG